MLVRAGSCDGERLVVSVNREPDRDASLQGDVLLRRIGHAAHELRHSAPVNPWTGQQLRLGLRFVPDRRARSPHRVWAPVMAPEATTESALYRVAYNGHGGVVATGQATMGIVLREATKGLHRQQSACVRGGEGRWPRPNPTRSGCTT